MKHMEPTAHEMDLHAFYVELHHDVLMRMQSAPCIGDSADAATVLLMLGNTLVGIARGLGADTDDIDESVRQDIASQVAGSMAPGRSEAL